MGLEGTSFHEAAQGFREETEVEWQFLSNDNGPCSKWIHDHGVTEDTFRWGKSAAASRQAKMFGEESVPLLAPGFDLLNHSNVPTAVLVDSSESPGGIVVKATSPMRKGDQILISYGPLSNASLLIFY